MDETDAALIFGSANIQKLTKFKMDGGVVDFGDQLHAAGSPQGTAIIAWSTDGRVAVKGVLFSDNFIDPQTASVEIRFKRSDGSTPSVATYSIATNADPWVGAKTVSKVSPSGQYNEVRLRLKQTKRTGSGTITTVLKTKTFKRA